MLAVERAIEYLDTQGLIDTNRVGLTGFSRFVCFVSYMLTHSNHRFAAATLVDGTGCGYFGEMAFPEGAWDINDIMGGAAPLGDGLKLWTKNSPTFNLDKVQTPIRLAAFGNGSVLSLWEWYVGLTLQKKPVDFIMIPRAAHTGGKLSQQILRQRDVVDWFTFWLKEEEDNDPTKAEQYKRWRDLRKLQEENEKKMAAPAN